MKNLKKIEEYFELVNQVKKKNTLMYSNCYLYQDEIQKLISQKRFYYEAINGGLIFYVDEKKYYETYYFLNVDTDWKIAKKDKDIVIKNIYIEGEKNKKLELLEEKLRISGFYLLDHLLHVKGDVELALSKLEKLNKSSQLLMQQGGLLMVPPDWKLVSQIREMLENIEMIPIYQIPYFTDEEMIAMGKEDGFICIVNRENELCALEFPFKKNLSYGYMAIKEEYQKLYGIAVALSFYRLNFLKERNLKSLAWIANTNLNSLKYHMNLGYHCTGRCMEEWVLRAKDKN